MKFNDLINENKKDIDESFVSRQSKLNTKEINVIVKKSGDMTSSFIDTSYIKATKNGSLYLGIWFDKEEEQYCANEFTIIDYINKPGYEIEMTPMPIKCFDDKSEALRFLKSYRG